MARVMACPLVCAGALALMCLAWRMPGSFCVGSARVTGAPAQPLAAGEAAVSAAARDTDRGSDTGMAGASVLCIGVAVLAAAAGARKRVVMRSQGQGGRFNFGQPFMPQLKKTKKRALYRLKKNYGTNAALAVPRRYPLYDILEELDETTPVYTVVEEPEEPMLPVEGVPITKRYPWAGGLGKLPKAKIEMEAPGAEERLEPYFGSIVGSNLPPTGRRQRYVYRQGWPNYNHPPWVNKPLIGQEVRVPGDMPWSKDRTPKMWQLKKTRQREIIAEKIAQKRARQAERKAARLARKAAKLERKKAAAAEAEAKAE